MQKYPKIRLWWLLYNSEYTKNQWIVYLGMTFLVYELYFKKAVTKHKWINFQNGNMYKHIQYQDDYFPETNSNTCINEGGKCQ